MGRTEPENTTSLEPLEGKHLFNEYLEMVTRFHGYPAPGVILGCYMVEMAKASLPDNMLYDVICETSWCLPDAVQLLTPCTIGNGWLKIFNLGLYAISLYDKFTGEGVRIFLDGRKIGSFDEISNWLLKLKPKKEQNSERLRKQIREGHHLICSKEVIRVGSEHLKKRSKGLISICLLCHEAYPSKHGEICRQCQGDSPYLSRRTQKSKTYDDMPALKSVKTEEAVGQKILHDMTRIIPGEYKGAAFRRGQTITGGDVCRLQQMGRNHLYVENNDIDSTKWIHEDQAAEAFAKAMAGEGTRPEGKPHEGKVNIVAERNGLLLIATERLFNFNLVPDVMAASRKKFTIIKKGKRIAGTRAIPLYLSKDLFNAAMAALGQKPLYKVQPFKPSKIGILVTGTEVFQGLVQDKFESIITGKVLKFGCRVVKTIIVPDDRRVIAEAVRQLVDAESEIIITTAGLSVDPEDLTLKGLLDAGATDLLHGAAVLPGAMTLLGQIGNTRLIGVPACALFHKTTSFDLLFPRIVAGVPITRHDLAELSHGGLCLECQTCSFPKCPFGK
jgi:formylmethanofuran dehydrogenase subunit E